MGAMCCSKSVIDIVQGQVELVVVGLRPSAILGATVSQDADNPHTLFGKEGEYPVIEQVISSSNPPMA